MEKKNREKLRTGLEILLFAAYLVTLCYFLFFAENLGRTFTEREYHYNLMPLKEIKRFWVYRDTLGFWSVALNLFGNVAAFLPFGAFLPRLFEKCRRFLLTTLFCFEFSLCVESIQLIWKVGSFDVDDILLNTLGGILGYWLYRFFMHLTKNGTQKELKQGGRNEKKKS